ncbi:Rab effector MyRIP [Bagarius yarrelli]|uniref:Rab effector MyRIP n=1 Tax=Bagarius yarrelli TaxID=175774 RepID=A0A556TVB9_BAGYA|nr:Rab effector MyRIP [Bagarius yarrelli]
MGRKLDMSNLTEEEAEHVLQVVQRDMQLRKKEEKRLGELKQELDEEESRCVLLSRQCGFNDRCCIRCCSSFTVFLKPRHRCLDCRYNVCRRCCSYSDTDKSWLCSACEKSRLLKTQSLEWFYSNVRRRFKRFGSAKVLKMLYRRHVGDQASQAEFTEGSTYADSTDDSVYESDSTFYKHTEERSMAESISVALRVAKEAIDDAITQAEKQPCNQEKLKEACYLRDNRGELIEELTTMILQTIICKNRDLSEAHTECTLEPPPDQNSNPLLSFLPNQPQSAFSLLTEEILAQHDKTEQSSVLCTQGLKADDVSSTAGWNQNIDWMENSCASSVLQSPDGNWFALQTAQLSRLSLPTKRENLMFSALEKESGVISAYDKIASDTESDSDGAWSATRKKINQKLSTSNLLNDHHATSSQPDVTIPTKYTADQSQSDRDQNIPVSQIQNPTLGVLKRKMSLEVKPCQGHSAMGITINPYGGESSEDGLKNNRVKKTRRRRRNKRDAREGKGSQVCSGESLSLSEPDYGRMLLNYLLKCQSKKQSVSEFSSDETMTADSVTPDILTSGAVTPEAFTPDAEDPTTEHHLLSGTLDKQLTFKLDELADQENGTQFPITHEIVMDNVEEAVDKRTEESEKTRKEKRDKKRCDALSDAEVDVKQKNLDIKENKERKGLLDVDDNKIENKTLTNTETLSTDMIGNLNYDILQETVKNESAIKIERAARMSEKEFYDRKIEMKKEPEKHKQKELNTINKINLDRLIKTTEDKANYLTTKISVDRNVKQEKKDRPESVEKDDTKPEPEKKQDSVKTNTPVENRIKKDERHEYIKQKGTEYEAENETNRLCNIGSRKSMNNIQETYSQDNLGEREKIDDKQKTKHVLEGLSTPEKLISNTTFTLPDLTDDSGKKKIMEKHEKQHPIPQGDEMGFHSETINRDEQTEKSDVENKSKSNVEKTKADDIQDHTLKDVQDGSTFVQEEFLSPEVIYKKYSAASLRSITTEVLKVLNATEGLIQGASQSESCDQPVLPPTQSKRLDEQLSRIEENVYVAASAVFGLEAELGDLEECARSISGDTTEEELSQLEEQVASAAAQIHQSERQVTDIAARIAALKSAGLNVAPHTRFSKVRTKQSTMPVSQAFDTFVQQ